MLSKNRTGQPLRANPSEATAERKTERAGHTHPKRELPVYPDPVDETLSETFPGSDPPSWWAGPTE